MNNFEMITILGYDNLITNSLLSFKRNLNKVERGIFKTYFDLKPEEQKLALENQRLIFIKYAYMFFQNLYTNLKPTDKFIDKWQHFLNDTIDKLKSELANEIEMQETHTQSVNTKKEIIISRIVNKFRGNIGEIMVESLIRCPVGNTINACSHDYIGVDPTDEPVFDCQSFNANVTSETPLPIYIQIKNFNNKSEIDDTYWKDVFKDACYQCWKSRQNYINYDDNQNHIYYIIFSFTSVKDAPGLSELIETHKKDHIYFFGSEDINKLNISGSAGKYFPNILENIRNAKIKMLNFL